MNDKEKMQGALSALLKKFPTVPDVRMLNDEQKAWIQMKIQSVADGVVSSETIANLQKIRNRLVHATEDLSDAELQKIVSFMFENMDGIEKLI